jgi:LysM repeat protein
MRCLQGRRNLGREEWKGGPEGQRRVTRGLGPVLSGLVAMVLVVLTLLVAVVLGMQEQALVADLEPMATDTITPLPVTPSPSSTTEPTTALPTLAATPTPLPSPSPTSTLQISPAATVCCAAPSDWRVYKVKRGETLRSLAWRFWTTEYRLVQANCLASKTLRVGQLICVPDVTPRQACGKPATWVAYTIQKGDTLSSLAVRLGVSIAQLKRANCLVGDTIYAGATLWVPHMPPHTLVPTRTPVPTQPSTATPTWAPTVTWTATATATSESTPETPTPETPTATVEPTGTDTSIPPTSTTILTDTPIPLTDTPTSSTQTPVLPTDTLIPPTATSVPLTNTPVPPTYTSLPPTSTLVPPTATISP